MKKIITAVALVVSAYGFSANCVEKNVKIVLSEEVDCTATYTNSKGVTFTVTAPTCGEALDKLDPIIEASEPKKVENELKEFEF